MKAKLSPRKAKVLAELEDVKRGWHAATVPPMPPMPAHTIPIDRIVDNPFQPRTTFDAAALRSLADEMKAEGFWSGRLQGRRTKTGTIELVFGHRRLRALKLLKTDAVPIEIVDLTDAQMALRALEENLQREGLTDLERADAVKRAVELVQTELRAAGKSESHAITQVATRLGLSIPWVSELCKISSAMAEEMRAPIRANHLTAKTALVAKDWGGDAYVKTLARQGKTAVTTGDVPKPTHMTVQAMKKVVNAAPEPVREKLKAAIIDGDVTTPAEAETKGRRLAAERTKRTKPLPPDFETAIVGLTRRYDDLAEHVKTVLIPYLAYLEHLPAVIANPFQEAQRALMEILQQTMIVEQKPTAKVITGSVVSRSDRALS